MHFYTRSFFIYLIIFSIISLNLPDANAKTKRGTLKVQNPEIDTSVIDPSINKLVILEAVGLNETILMKPASETLRGAKAVKVKGTFKNDTLEVDLRQL